MSLLAFRCFTFVAAMAALTMPAIATPSTEPTVGLPITRNYALDEIGDVSRGVRLGFDRIGRLAVIGGDAYVVLNDTTWLDIAHKADDTPSMMQVVTDATGFSYFGGLAAWGEAEYTEDGRLRSRTVRPADCPEWVTSTNFVHIVPQGPGAYFAGANGAVYWNRATGEHVFFAVRGGTTIFALGQRVFASSYSGGIQLLDLARGSVEPLDDGILTEIVVEHAIDLGDRTLLATVTGRLLVFDGNTVTPWSGPLSGDPSGRVTGLKRLTDGGIAIAVDGRGLFILSDEGEIRLSLTSPEYHRIHDVAVREAGVLWVATESVVQKLFYGSPVSIVDRRLGLPIGWPQVVQWNGQTLIASSGRLYESLPSDDRLSTRFALVADQPLDGAWAIAANGSRLLIGNRAGVYARAGDAFEPTLPGIEVSRLVMASPDLCYVIGPMEIAALRWADGRWSECTPRLPGVGFPAIVHSVGTSAWIELGADRVARLTLEADGLKVRVFTQFPWTEPRWVNIGVVDHIVVLSGGRAGALFFDERTGDFGEAPELRQFLASIPAGFARVRNDSRGNLWVSHERGVLLSPAGPETDGGVAPGRSFDRIVRDFQPLVQIAGPDDVWISTEKTLYHVNRSSFGVRHDSVQPFLTSVVDRRTGQELYSAMRATPRIKRLPFAQNSLSFRFFSGSYATMRPPLYEFTMRSRSSEWSTQSTDSLLALHDLKEGTYRLSVRLLDPTGRPPEPMEVEFSIAPPWHRSPVAYAAYGTAAVLAGCGLFFWAIRRTRRRNVFLENLVRERTDELRSTMARLNEEARNTATLAERNRLAGEIHDSLQQGLSGLMLQLDATLKLPELAADVRSRLIVARNMVSFTRHEVQQAVWDLESPLLENADLAEALRKMAGLISSGTPRVEIKTTGIPADVSSPTAHQLLRISQEAITNAVRHGNARRILVRLDYSEAALSLEILDDGRGFIPQEVFANGIGHFGLRGLRGRASKINADLKIISALNRGTIVRIVIPLTPNASPAPAHANVASA